MAIKSQNTAIAVSTATASAKTITAATAANPVVVTSSAHGLTAGTIVVITGVVGMIQLNNRSFVVANPATNTFELKGIDGTSYTTYTSGGSATPQTMTAVGEVTSADGFDGQASEIDTTNLLSTAKEFLLGLQDFGGVNLGLFMKNTDTGQQKMRSLKTSASTGTFSITLSNGEIAAFQALVKQFSFQGITPDGAVTAQSALRVTGEPSWFA